MNESIAHDNDLPIDKDKFIELSDEMEDQWANVMKPIWDEITAGMDWSAETNP